MHISKFQIWIEIKLNMRYGLIDTDRVEPSVPTSYVLRNWDKVEVDVDVDH